ncbi:arylformamidase [Alsobacter sp. R-9]
MAIIDISPPFRAGMPGWPGDTPFEVAPTWSIGPGCPVNVSRIVLSSHVGAHADAPLHFDAAGAAIDALPLEPFLGPCHVVDARSAGEVIAEADVLPSLPERVERVLIRQYDRYPDAWDAGLKGLSPSLIEALAARGAVLVGVDAASVDPSNSKDLAAHHAIQAAGIRILEGLVLDHVTPGAYELVALPLRIAGCDAAPVRAVLRPLPLPDRGQP